MSRKLIVGAAQLGPIARSDSRRVVVGRLVELMREAKARGCDLVVYPELALTTFFPRWYFEQQDEVDTWFEREMPGLDTQALFDEARRLAIGFYLGYAELAEQDGRVRHFNTSILVGKSGELIGKYRKIHLPGHTENEPWRQLSISRSVISNAVIWGSRPFRRSSTSTRASLAWRYATTDAGRKPIGSSACRGSRWH